MSQVAESIIRTPAGQITVRPAGAGDLETVLVILEEAAGWLAARGIDQWRTGAFQREPLARRIARGEVYLATCGEDAVGTLTLQWTDPFDRKLWGASLEEAGYVHRLAVRRTFAGREIGRYLLRWAAEQVAAAGKPYLRLDCMAENLALRAYYERAGFQCRGSVAGPGWSACLYEQRVSLAG